MLNQRLFPRAYIPINPAPLPALTEFAKEERRLRRLQAKRRKEREAALSALQLPMALTFALVACPAEDPIDDLVEDPIEATIEQPSEDLAAEGPSAVAIGPDVEDEPVEWLNEEIVRLHGVLLEQSLRALAAAGNPREKLDVLEWIFETEYVGDIVRETDDGPRRIAVTNRDCALSFSFCCRLEGHDPDFWRGFIKREMPEAASRFIFSTKDVDLPSHKSMVDQAGWI